MAGNTAPLLVEHHNPTRIRTIRTILHRYPKYWPEVTGFLLMMAYTAARTLAVAHGVDTVAHTHWQIFLIIEIVTTLPYVWGIGDLVRGAVSGAHSTLRDGVGMISVLTGIFAPYVYLAAAGGMRHHQSALITGIMVIIALIGLAHSLRKLGRTNRARREREATALAVQAEAVSQ